MTKNEELQNLWRQYEEEHDHIPASARAVSEWAIERGLIDPPQVDLADILAGQISRALRQEYATDEHGRRYRRNHAIRVTNDGVQLTVWGILGHANHEHMEMAFSQRREQIISDCVQLKADVDVYNDLNPDQEPVQLILDFTDDVAEREIVLELA